MSRSSHDRAQEVKRGLAALALARWMPRATAFLADAGLAGAECGLRLVSHVRDDAALLEVGSDTGLDPLTRWVVD